ncbi:MAG: hypothetical protein EHM90_00780 [Chloroflexi bacterium]|nr:MAG: hypothetical protein EHM90_00780 [Chloroflexota bacterium]
MNQRPTGVTILAILAFIGGAFGILGALALLGLGFAFAGAAAGGLGFIFGIVLLLLSILYLWIGWGFWNLKRSAWSLGLVVFGAGIVISFIELLLGYGTLTNLIVTIVINGIVIYYLLTPGVKAAFGVEGDLQSAVMSGLPGGSGAAAASAPPPAPPAAPPAAEPPAAPSSTWTGDSGSAPPSTGADDSDKNA